MNELLHAILAGLVAKATPLTFADAKVLAEVLDAGWRSLSNYGVQCVFALGESAGKSVCRPQAWRGNDWAYRARVCGRCPVFKEALRRRRERT